MKDNYILRLSDNKLICFYQDTDQNLYCREYTSNRWTEKKILFKNIQPNYTVTLSQNGAIYIFCQDIEGSIILMIKKSEEESWDKRVILKNQSDSIHTILFNPFILNHQMTLLYNIPGENRTYKLISQSLDNNGTWGHPQEIDIFAENRNNYYSIQDVSPAHYIAFYRANVKENNIGYKEITPEKWSDFNYIYQTGYNITDTSFLTTKEGIHCLLIVKSMFSCQLIYRRKTSGGFTPAQVICETQRMENCLISIIKNSIYITFMSNGQLFMCISKNNGISFSKPEVFRQKLCREPVKAKYLSQENMDEKNFYVREVYVDLDYPWDIQFITEILPDFIHSSNDHAQNIAAASLPKRQNEFYNPENAAQQYTSLLEENAFKDQHLSNMSNLLKERTKKLEDTKAALEKIKNMYTQKMNEMDTKISNLTAENQRLMLEIKNFSIKKKEIIVPLENSEDEKE